MRVGKRWGSANICRSNCNTTHVKNKQRQIPGCTYSPLCLRGVNQNVAQSGCNTKNRPIDFTMMGYCLENGGSSKAWVCPCYGVG